MTKENINKSILQLAVPNIISNITVPLLGLVDMSIVGHLSSDNYIGAIAIASVMFNFIYWTFSFLRMGTSGFTSQAFGAQNKGEIRLILFRSLFIAAVAGFILILFQSAIFNFAFHVINSSQEVKFYAHEYFNIYIWSAPAVLGLYTFSGWFIGMQNSRTPMYIAVFINILNICFSLYFVYVLDLSIRGVALGSTLAQWCGFLLAVVFWQYKYNKTKVFVDVKELFVIADYIPFFRVNADIFVRTMLLILVTSFFTSVSAKMGNTILAANALLMQLFTLFSYIMDGFAYAAEALTGKFIGAKKSNVLSLLIKSLFKWGTVLAILFTIFYALFTDQILSILTDQIEVINICKKYQFWVLLVPLAGFPAFLWDGIFIGAMASQQMRNSMLVAAVSFFVIYYLFSPQWGNQALWFAFIIYLSMRGLMQLYLYKGIRKKVFA